MNRLLASIRCTTAPLRRRSALVRGEDGFSLIEVTMAAVVLAILATALIGLLQSAIAANGLARQKTVAQQMAQDQVEYIRKLDYTTEIGIPGGNPNGIVAASKTISVRGTQATMTTEIDWVADSTPGAFVTNANYKKVTVRITSNRNGAVLTSVVTYVSPPGRAPFGGLNNATINVKVQDMGYATNTYIPGAIVDLATGPSAPLSDTTDSGGLVTFPALTANPTSGPQAYYDITATKSGYLTYVDDRVPGAASHVQVAPSQTLGPQVIRLYKAAIINVALTNSSGNPYTSLATVKATSQRLGVTQSFTTSTGSLSIPTFAGDPVVPGDFTLRAFTSTGGLCADPLPQYVPDNYPTTLTTTFALQLLPCPSGTLVVNVTQMGGPAQGATVTVKDGPNDYTPVVQTTNSSGQTIFTNLPSGTDPYNITVTDAAGNVTATGTAVIATGATTTSNIALSDPPMGTIRALVQAGGVNVAGATVVVTGGPYPGFTRTLVTNSSGVADFSNVIPAGNGYTVTATKGTSANVSSVNVTAGSTTNVTIPLPTANLTVTATWLGTAVNLGSVTVTGGPAGGTYTGTTNASGVATIVVPQATSAYPYTVTVTRYAGSGSSAVTSVPAGGASTAVALAQTGTITVTGTWLSLFAGNATVSITGGPVGGTYTGTTIATTGVALPITVPITGSGSPTYTVQVTKNGQSASVGSVTVTNGANTPSTVNLTQSKTFTITIQRGGVAVSAGTSINLSITGGPNGTASAAPAYTFTRTAGAGGVLPVVTVPLGTSGSTYQIRAYLNPCGASGSNRSRTVTGQPNTGANTNLTINMNSSTCPPALP